MDTPEINPHPNEAMQDMVIKTVDMWYRCPGNIRRVGELAIYCEKNASHSQ